MCKAFNINGEPCKYQPTFDVCCRHAGAWQTTIFKIKSMTDEIDVLKKTIEAYELGLMTTVLTEKVNYDLYMQNQRINTLIAENEELKRTIDINQRQVNASLLSTQMQCKIQTENTRLMNKVKDIAEQLKQSKFSEELNKKQIVQLINENSKKDSVIDILTKQRMETRINEKQLKSMQLENEDLQNQLDISEENNRELKDDLADYNTIREYSKLFNRLSLMAETDDVIKIGQYVDKFRNHPHIIELLGNEPKKEFHIRRKTRNNLAHLSGDKEFGS